MFHVAHVWIVDGPSQGPTVDAGSAVATAFSRTCLERWNDVVGTGFPAASRAGGRLELALGMVSHYTMRASISVNVPVCWQINLPRISGHGCKRIRHVVVGLK